MLIEKMYEIKVTETIYHFDDDDELVAQEEPESSVELVDLATEFAFGRICDKLRGCIPSSSQFGPNVWYTRYEDKYNGTAIEYSYYLDNLPLVMQSAVFIEIITDGGRAPMSAVNKEARERWLDPHRLDLIPFVCGYLVAVEEAGRVCGFGTADAEVRDWFYANYEALMADTEMALEEQGYYLYALRNGVTLSDFDPKFVQMCRILGPTNYDKQEEEVMAVTDDLEIDEEDECEECGEYAECSVCEDCGALLCESCEETHECDDEDDDDV